MCGLMQTTSKILFYLKDTPWYDKNWTTGIKQGFRLKAFLEVDEDARATHVMNKHKKQSTQKCIPDLPLKPWPLL